MNVSSPLLRVSHEQLAWGVNKLKEFVAIPCVSNKTSQDYSMEALRQGAKFAGDNLEKLGLDVRYVSIDGSQPYVIAQYVQDVSLPTVIVYAHYDKQPVDRAKWKTDPFKLEFIGGRLYGRGASDDGGGLAVILTALKVRQEANAKLSSNLIVLMEGEEEVASPNMLAFLKQEHATFASADALIILDGENRDVETGTLDGSTRGINSIDVTATALKEKVHSGLGAICPDPNMALSILIASLKDPWQIPGYMDGAKKLTAEEITVLNESSVSVEDYRQQKGVVKGASLRGDPKKSIYQRIVDEPSISVTNFNGGNFGGGNSIPASAHATVNLRFIAGQDPVKATEAVIHHLKSQQVSCPVTITSETPSGAWKANLSGPFNQCYLKALEDGFSKATVLPCGGTIPLFSLFEEAFPKMEMLLVGVEDPETSAHGPNESQHLGVLEKSINSFNAFLDRAGQIRIKV